MRLVDNGGIQLEIHIIGYEFSADHLGQRKLNSRPYDNTYDPNWLNIAIKVETSQAKWDGQAACALVTDMERLTEYFEAIATNKSHDPMWICLDADFHFEERSHADQTAILQLILKYRFAFPGEKVTTLVLEINDLVLLQVVSELREALLRYPRRGDLV